MRNLRTQVCSGLMSTFRRQLAIQYRRTEFTQRQQDHERSIVLPTTVKRKKSDSN